MNRRSRLIAGIAGTILLGCASQQPDTRVSAFDDAGEMPFASPAGEASYHVLMAEIALERGEWEVSASEYRRAAVLSDDPATAERAARVAHDHGQFDDAHTSASRWYALDPDSSAARNMLISLNVRRGQLHEAEALLDDMLAEAEAEGWLGDGMSMAAALLSVGENRESGLAMMRRVVSRYPALAEAHFNLAMLCLRAGQPEQALAPAQRTVALDPQWLRAHTMLASVLLELDRIDEALAVAAEAGELPNAGPEFRLRHSMLLLTAGEIDQARDMLDAILDEDPGMVEARRQAGLLALREGRTEDARDHFRRMLGSGDQLSALYLLARTEDLRGDYSRAAHLYAQVTDGEYVVPAQVRLSDILVDLGRADEALANLEDYARMHPQHELPFTEARAAVLASLGRDEEALAVYDDAIARRPDVDSLRFGRAYLLERMDRVDEAIAAMEQLVREQPDSATALNALGYTLADRTDRHREAARYISQALRLEPDNPAIIDSMGWVEYRRGRYARAIAHLERAWSLMRDPEVAAHLGEVLWMAGRKEDARAVWRDALSTFPDDDGLNAVMARFAD
jgi:tetratricopeptide (TPR) repeat protein